MGSDFDIFSVISNIILFILGAKFQGYKTKKSNVREKARSIDATIVPMLKQKISDLCVLLTGRAYIEYDDLQPKPVLKLAPNYFIEAVKSDSFCSIFNIENEKIVLIYTKDSNLKKHMNRALDYFNDYQKRAHRLEELIESLNTSKPPSSFVQTSMKIGVDELGEDTVKSYTLKDKDFFSLYFLAMTGSKNAYKRGTSFVIKLLEDRFEDIQYAAVNNPENSLIYNEIETEISGIKLDLKKAYDEIQKLHEVWQNELII